jgi:hypothetical protein
MKLSRLVAFASLICATPLSANEAGPPPITRQTLCGVWEAVSSANPCVFRLEVNSSGTSYLVFPLGSYKIICRMTAATVHEGKIQLRFVSLKDSGMKPGAVTITGHGYADKAFGAFQGELRMKIPSEEDFVETVSFAKPPWGWQVQQSAKKSEELMREAKETTR